MRCCRVNHDLCFFQFIGQTLNGRTSQVHCIVRYSVLYCTADLVKCRSTGCSMHKENVLYTVNILRTAEASFNLLQMKISL